MTEQITYATGLPVVITYDPNNKVFTFDVDLAEFLDFSNADELTDEERDLIIEAGENFAPPQFTGSFTTTGDTFFYSAESAKNAEVTFVPV